MTGAVLAHGVQRYQPWRVNLSVNAANRVPLMAAVGCATAAMAAHPVVPAVAEQGLAFLVNLSVNAANLPNSRAMQGLHVLVCDIKARCGAVPDICRVTDWLSELLKPTG